MRRAVSTTLSLLVLATVLGAGCGRADEGESCDAAKGNDDCAEGLICRSAFEVQAKESVCCPPPPARPSTSECQPAIDEFMPDPGVDASFGGGGGSGGSSGSGGSGGSSGSSGSSGSGGGAGADGSATGGSAGADAGDASTDSAADVASDSSSD